MERKPHGLIESPAGMLGHLTPLAIPMEQCVAEELARRAEYDARPDVVQKRIEDAHAVDRMKMEKLAKKGKAGGVYGPPDPRKGRLPMTR